MTARMTALMSDTYDLFLTKVLHGRKAAGFELTPVPDSHLCCGSAGTYSILQPELSAQLKRNKLAALASGEPEEILTANIGCLAHLQSGTERPVRHWIVALEERLSKPPKLTQR